MDTTEVDIRERIKQGYYERLTAAQKREEALYAYLRADQEYHSVTSKYVQLLEDYFAESKQPEKAGV